MFDFDVVTGPTPAPGHSTQSPDGRSPDGRSAVRQMRGGGKAAPDCGPAPPAASSGSQRHPEPA